MSNVSLYDFSSTSIAGRRADFAAKRGSVFLIVNTASACGFTPQFKGLEKLWEDYRERGLIVVGFPCNQFGAQDPGNNGEIAAFCERNYGVTFPMMSKVDVNGDHADPLFQWLKKAAPGMLGSEAIKWNFTKFLVGRDGRVIKRYAPNEEPENMRKDIEQALGP
ncbi:MAG TPA: glutathione peroxidase [Burkholderiaceae bacterium]|nr:glutathione peroxidase [Burkholderiaceae bacterium]